MDGNFTEEMKTNVDISDFLKLIKYKPKYVGSNHLGMRYVEFRGRGNKKAHLEFEEGEDGDSATPPWTKQNGNGFYLYFEIIDLSSYRYGELIPIDSGMRSSVVWTYCKSLSDYRHAAEMINSALKSLYRRKKPLTETPSYDIMMP